MGYEVGCGPCQVETGEQARVIIIGGVERGRHTRIVLTGVTLVKGELAYEVRRGPREGSVIIGQDLTCVQRDIPDADLIDATSEGHFVLGCGWIQGGADGDRLAGGAGKI